MYQTGLSDPRNASSGSDVPPEFEDIVDRLRSLRKGRRRLKGTEKMEALRLMRILREDDYSPIEISRITYWPLTTVKQYVKGIRGKNRTSRQKAINTIRDMISAKITFREIREYIETKSNLTPQYQLTFKDIASFLQEIRQGYPQLTVADIIRQHSKIKNSGLTTSQLVAFLGYKAELERQGFTVDLLRRLSRSSAKYGGLTNAIEALNLYNNAAEIEQQIRTKEARKEVLETNLATLGQEVRELDRTRIDMQEGLDTLEALERAGFDTYVLIVLKELAERYDQDPQTFLAAVRQYSGLEEIASRARELESANTQADSKLKRLEAQYNHRRAVLDVCDKLLGLGFNPQAIQDLYRAAQRYGEPREILSRVGMLGDLDAVDRRVQELNVTKSSLEPKVAELEAKFKTFGSSVTPSLDAINQGFTRASQNLGAVYKQEVAQLKKAAETTAEAKALEKELELARIINAAVNNRSKIQSLAPVAALAYAISLLNASYLLCVTKKFNSIFKARDVGIIDAHNFLSDSDVKTLDLIKGAQRALELTMTETASSASAVNNPTPPTRRQDASNVDNRNEVSSRQQDQRSASVFLPRYFLHEHHTQEGLRWIISLEIDAKNVLKSWILKEKPSERSKRIAADQTNEFDIDSLRSGATATATGRLTELDSGTFRILLNQPEKIVLDIDGNELAGEYCLANLEANGNRWEFYKTSFLSELGEAS